MKAAELPPAIRDKMKKAFLECHKAVMACEDETGRRRCELFKDLPDRRVRDYQFSAVEAVADVWDVSGLSGLLSSDQTAHCVITHSQAYKCEQLQNRHRLQSRLEAHVRQCAHLQPGRFVGLH